MSRLALVLLALLLPLDGRAEERDIVSIAAVVNDEVISQLDLEARIALVLTSTNLSDTPETRARLRPQILRQLVDERLKLQEAERVKITIEDEEVNAALANLEKQSRMQPGDLLTLLDQLEVPQEVLRRQIEADLAWGKVARRGLALSADVSDVDVTERLEELEANSGKPEHLLAEIVLPYDGADDLPEVMAAARRLVQQIRSGVPFPAVAQQFSQSPSAARGGDLGWVPSGVLEEAVDKAVQDMRPGTVSEPIQGLNNVIIMALRERRDPTADALQNTFYDVAQLSVPTQGRDARRPEAVNAAVETVTQATASCETFTAAAEKVGGPGSGRVGAVRASELPPKVREAVATLEIGAVTPALDLGPGTVVIMLCDKRSPLDLPDREEVRERLRQERMENIARRQLRDLRRTAVIDLRL